MAVPRALLLSAIALTVLAFGASSVRAADVCESMPNGGKATITVPGALLDPACNTDCAGNLPAGVPMPPSPVFGYVDGWQGQCALKNAGPASGACKRDTFCPNGQKTAINGVWKCQLPAVSKQVDCPKPPAAPTSPLKGASAPSSPELKLPNGPTLRPADKALPPAPPPPPPVQCTSQCDVSRDGRALIVLNRLQDVGKPEYKKLYEFLETSGWNVTQASLGGQYVNVEQNPIFLGYDGGFTRALARLEDDPKVKAIDVVVILHGADKTLAFGTRGQDVDDTTKPHPTGVGSLYGRIWLERLKRCADEQKSALTAPRRTGTVWDYATDPAATACIEGKKKKLRAVVSTACYGASHADGWKRIGFKVVSGAIAVHADSPASYPAFLGGWANGYTFAQSIERANRADQDRAYDRYAEKNGFTDVNSVRNVYGNGQLRIWSLPAP